MFFNLEMSIWEPNKEAWPGLFGPNIISKISQPLWLLLSLLQYQISSEHVTVAPRYKEKSASRQINILTSIHSFSFFNSWRFLMLKVKKTCSFEIWICRSEYGGSDDWVIQMAEHWIMLVMTMECGWNIVSYHSFSQLYKMFRNIFSISRLIENPQKIFRCLLAANIYN